LKCTTFFSFFFSFWQTKNAGRKFSTTKKTLLMFAQQLLEKKLVFYQHYKVGFKFPETKSFWQNKSKKRKL
jgi:hypothetical protein